MAVQSLESEMEVWHVGFLLSQGGSNFLKGHNLVLDNHTVSLVLE
jgi:hypothetical protein